MASHLTQDIWFFLSSARLLTHFFLSWIFFLMYPLMTNISSYWASPPHGWKNSLAILIAALSGIFSDAAELSANKKRPNILFILVDDQSPQDLEIYNPRSILQTPNIDRIARAGMILDNAHHMGAWIGGVCTPSRHMIMSGRTVWHIPSRKTSKSSGNSNESNPRLVPRDLARHTLGAIFNRAEYDTMRTCKRGNSYAAANKQFTVVRDATKRGATPESGSEWHADQVLDFLTTRESNSNQNPFFIYFGFSHPHDTRNGTPELLKKYGAINHMDKNSLPPANPAQPPLPLNYLPQHPFHHGHPNLRDEVRVKGVWNKRDERTIRNELGREFACSENIDIQIGRVLSHLEKSGELENTYVIYTADHGMAIGRHGLQGKQNLYEHSWKVPYIVMGPGVQANTRAKGNIYLLDTLTTLCDLTDVTNPSTSEGISFAPVLFGEKDIIRDTLYGVYCGGTKPGIRCVKKGDWKLIKYDVMESQVRETQLFNLKFNPHEYLPEHQKNAPWMTNLANIPEFAAKRAEMESLLLSEMIRLNDPYQLWDQ